MAKLHGRGEDCLGEKRQRETVGLAMRQGMRWCVVVVDWKLRSKGYSQKPREQPTLRKTL